MKATRSIKTFIKTTLSIKMICYYSDCNYAECPILFIAMLNVVMLNVIVLCLVAPIPHQSNILPKARAYKSKTPQ